MWPLYSHRQSPCWLIWRERRRTLFFWGAIRVSQIQRHKTIFSTETFTSRVFAFRLPTNGGFEMVMRYFSSYPFFFCFPWCIYPTVATGIRHTSAYVDWGYKTWPCPNCFPARSYYSRGNRIIISLGEQELWCHLLSDYSKSGLCTTLAALTESNSFNE